MNFNPNHNKKMNKQEIEQTIANVEQQLAALKAELLKQVSPKPTKKWERNGDWVLFGNGTTVEFRPNKFTADAGLLTQGRTYKTKEAAESVIPYDSFYGLLCGLACELNPSGKVGGYWGVTFLAGSLYWAFKESLSEISTNRIFETEEAVRKAAEILNRDGIKPPQFGGAQ